MERIRTDDRTAEVESATIPLGALYVSVWAQAILAQARVDRNALLQRHRAGDWGALDEQDRQRNEQALMKGEQVASSFALANGDEVVILTHVGKRETTIVTTQEYDPV